MADATREQASDGVRLAELLAAMSLGIDLGLGQPMDHVLRSTAIAMRLGTALGLDDGQQAALYYVSLLAWVGCGADSYELARWFGDDLRFRADAYRVDLTGIAKVAFVARRLGKGNLGFGCAAVELATEARDAQVSHCAAASTFAERLELGPEVREPLWAMSERWDGKGPRKLRGDAIPLQVRIVQLADVVTFFRREAGVEGAKEAARARRGTMFGPSLVDRICRGAADICGGLDGEANWDAVIDAEPGLRT
jgi:hypothetical protein